MGANCSRLSFEPQVPAEDQQYLFFSFICETHCFPTDLPTCMCKYLVWYLLLVGQWVSNTIAQPQSPTALWHRPVWALRSPELGGWNTSRLQVRSQHTSIFRLQAPSSRDRCFVLCLDSVLPVGPWLQVKALQCHTNTVKLNNKIAEITIVISTCFDLLPQTHQPQTLVRVYDYVFQTANACKTPTVFSHMEKGEKVRKTIAYNRSHHPDSSGLPVFSSSCKKSLPTPALPRAWVLISVR